MNINEFLEALETQVNESDESSSTKNFLTEGKENDKVREEFRNALKEQNINWEWLYQPDDRDMVVAELKGNNQWGIFTFGKYKTMGEDIENMFDPEVMQRVNEIKFGDEDDEEGEVEVGKENWEVSGKYQGDFLTIVKECMEVAKSDQFKSDKDGVQDDELPQNFKKV
jgi:hypothetical protein